MPNDKPPYRADQVGSLLRPQAIHDARAAHAKGDLSDEALREIEDEHIRDAIKKQENVGLKAVTDGEFRRSWWHFDFLGGLDGVEIRKSDSGIQFAGVQTKAETLTVVGKIGFSDHPMLEHFKFVHGHTKAVPKMTIPSPSVLHFRQDEEARRKAYADDDEFWHDLGTAYADAVKGFYAAGCRYLQFDDTVWAYLCSQDELDKAKQRGLNIDGIQGRYADTINMALAAKPADMTITMHVCRGNFKSTWISSGGYEPVAETILSRLNLDGYFLEYDTDRAGDFQPLRFLPKGNKQVVLGLVTSKTGELEQADQIKARIEEASQFADTGQFCLSPQCGFASTEEGNILTEDEQWRKLELIVGVARDVWGEL